LVKIPKPLTPKALRNAEKIKGIFIGKIAKVVTQYFPFDKVGAHFKSGYWQFQKWVLAIFSLVILPLLFLPLIYIFR
jgi:hypothetical protein